MKQILLLLFTGLLGMHSTAQVLADPSLETSGPANSPWSSTSSNFGTSFCDLAGCGSCGGPCVPNTGSWYAWFGGTTNSEVGIITQQFNATVAGVGTLTYFLKVPMKGAIGDTLSVILDGTTISKTNTVDSIGTYQQITVDAGTLSIGTHNLMIRFQKQAGAAVVNVLVDDIQLTIGNSVSIEEIDFSNGIQISNNIESGKIMVAYNFNENQNIRLSVTDITGKVVYQGQFNEQTANQHSIDSKDWSTGMYNVTLTSDRGELKTKKVVVN